MFSSRFHQAVLLIATVGCASSAPPATTATPSTPTTAATPSTSTATATSAKPNPNLITATELADESVKRGDALAAIRHLRPGFLVSRAGGTSQKGAGTTHVSIDGGPLVALSALSDIPANEVAEIRYLSAPDAAQRFGSAAGSGPAILVKRK